MHSAIIRATKPADAPTQASLAASRVRDGEELALAGGCCGGDGCC
jgi:hypothetical protein